MVVFKNEHKRIIVEKDIISYYNEEILFSKSYINEPLKYSFYLISTVLGLLNKSKKVLILGTGLGTAILQFKELIPTAEITAVDIDQEVFALGRKYFGLSKYKDIKYVVADAGEYVKGDIGYYDYIMVDLYDGAKLLNNFIEVDFLHNIFCRLDKNGVLAFNSSMRDFSCFDCLSKVSNPLKYIYQNMFSAGFVEVTKLNYSYSGWIHCFKTNSSDLFREMDNIKSDSKYVMAALGVQRIFTHKIEKGIIYGHSLEGHELMAIYRDYLINLVMKIKRGNFSTLCDEEGKDKILKLFISYTRRRIDAFGGGIIKDMFLCNDVNYFKDLNVLLEKYHYSLGDVMNIVMLPEKNLLEDIGDVMSDVKFKIFGSYQYDIVNEDDREK